MSERFNNVRQCDLKPVRPADEEEFNWWTAHVTWDPTSETIFIITDGESIQLDVDQARRLRDWLNTALPKEEHAGN